MSDAARIRSLEASLDDAHATEQRLNGTVAALRSRLQRIERLASIDWSEATVTPVHMAQPVHPAPANPHTNPVPLTTHTSPTGKIG